MDGSPPTVTLPKLMLLELSPKTPGDAPVPETAIVNVGLEPSEVMVTIPVKLATDCGAKLTLKVVLCAAFRVRGVVIPLRVKPVPLILACETLTLVPPVLVSVTVED